MTDKAEWFIGGNGNLFSYYKGFRYAILRLREHDYSITRNGVEIAHASSEAEAKLFVRRDC